MPGSLITRRRVQQLALAGVAAAAAGGLAACEAPRPAGAPERGTPAGGGSEAKGLAAKQELAVNIELEPTMDPAWGGGAYRYYTPLEAVFAGLIKIGQDMAPRADLAEKWDVSPDSTTYTFTLRKGLKFSDGSPLTAEDVRYTLLRGLTPARPEQFPALGVTTPYSFFYDILDDVVGARELLDGKATSLPPDAVVVRDAQTIQLKIKEPRSDFLARIGSVAMGVVKKANVEETSPSKVWWLNPIGAGPFKIDSWKPKEEIVMVPNDHYYGDKPKLTRIRMRIIADPQTALVVYQNGELDVTKPDVPDVERIKQTAQASEMKEGEEAITGTLRLNPIPPLDDVHVRRALYQAIDRETLTRVIFKGAFQPATTFIQPLHKGYDLLSGYTPLKFDPAAAKAELKQAKYAPNEIRVRYFVPGGLASREGIAPGLVQRIAAAIQQMWQDSLGITVDIKAAESEADTLDTASHLYFTRWGVAYHSPGAMVDKWVNDVLQLTAFPKPLLKPVDAPGLRDLQLQARRETDDRKRWALYGKFEMLINEYRPLVPLYYGRTYVLQKPWVSGLTIGRMWNFPDLQKVSILAR